MIEKESQIDVLIIMGSHRKKGFSMAYTQGLIEQLSGKNLSTFLLDVNDYKVSYCLDCPYCKNNHGVCICDDQMDLIYEQMKRAKHLVVVSPVYFNNITSKLKTIVDRTQMIFMCDFAHKKSFVTSHLGTSKKAILVSFGGAKSYDNQFLGSLWTFEWVFRNLKTAFVKHYTYPGTDHMETCSLTEEMKNDLLSIVNQLNEV